MKCMYCGTELARENYCPNCRVDMKLYKKIIMTSNYFYNEGLSRASVRNLSGAIESLNKSLRYNKMNIQARNLLGLVYFEVGEMVSALSEWVISRSLQSEQNDAERYLNAIQKNSSKLETINQTIKKYNQALLYCKQDSKDLATIQLKKVLSLNPKLVKGHQLLALLYIQEGKYDAARKSLRSAGKIDSGNTLTLRYLKEVNGMLRGDVKDKKEKKHEKNEDLISYKSGNETIIQPAHFKDNSAVATIVNIIIGVAIGACITGFLIVPSVRHAAQNEANAAVKEANDTISTKNQTIESLQNQIDELTGKIDDAKDASQETASQIAAYEQLLTAYAAYTENNIAGAGEALSSLNTEYLSTEAKRIYDSINATVNAQYIETTYNDGYNAYNQRNYTVAAENLQKVVDMEENYKDGNAIYYLAQSYRNLGENEKAAEYYQKMVAQYPGTERAANSQKYLDTMDLSDTGNTGEGGADDGTPEDGNADNSNPDGNPAE